MPSFSVSGPAGTSTGRWPAAARTSEVVDQVAELLAGLPLDQRLPALGEVQQRILEQTVAERLAQGE